MNGYVKLCEAIVWGCILFVLGSGFRVLGSEFWVLGYWFWVIGSELLVLSYWFWVIGSEFRVLGSGFWVIGSEFCTTIWQVLRTLRKKFSCDHVGAGLRARPLNSHGRTRTNTDWHGRGQTRRPTPTIFAPLRLCV